MRGYGAPLLVLPTGAGKTMVLAAITAGAHAKGRSTLVVVHRRELLKQASEKLRAAGVPHGVIAAGVTPAPEELVQLASIQTVTGRLAEIGAFALIVFDEAHHTRAAQYAALVAAQPQARLLGVTATPARLDGQGLGVRHGGCFDDLIIGASTGQLIAQGYLSQVRCFVPAERISLGGVRVRNGDYAAGDLTRLMDNTTITGDAVEQYRRRADHQPALVFCASIAHAEHVADAFAAAGYRSACVHGGMKFAQRAALISGVGSGAIEVLTSCDLISEGLDVPIVGAVILLRPTRSLVLHRQQVGRGMRPADGKTVLVVNDHVGNSLVHGLPESEPAWSLAGVAKQRGQAPVWRCLECEAVNTLECKECLECGCGRPAQSSARRLVPSTKTGELAELTREQLRALPYWAILQRKHSEDELRAIAAARGYRPGWVRHRKREQELGR